MQPVKTDQAPAAIGPYSQAMMTEQLIYTSGQIPLDPKTGELVDPTDISKQCEQVMKNLEGVLGAAGSSFAKVIKTTIYLTDLGHFATVNEIYGKRFEGITPPARTTIQVAALPKGAKVEIEMIAAR